MFGSVDRVGKGCVIERGRAQHQPDLASENPERFYIVIATIDELVPTIEAISRGKPIVSTRHHHRPWDQEARKYKHHR